MSSALTIPVKTIKGEETTLGELKGKAFLVLNVASKCGLTPQYEAAEKLYQEKKDNGLVIVGFPANDFLAQEPGTDDEIQEFCTTKYNVTFPLFSKIKVTGDDKHPLYKNLIEQQPVTTQRDLMAANLKNHGISTTEAPEVIWNFEKFLLDADGKVVARFAPHITVDSDIVTEAINKLLE